MWILNYGTLFLLVVRGWRDVPLRGVVLSGAGAVALFGGPPFYGQSFTFGASIWAASATALVWLGNRKRSLLWRFAALSATGSVAWFFDLSSGAVCLGLGYLVALGGWYALVVRRAAARAVIVWSAELLAFALGVLSSLFAKQVACAYILGGDVLGTLLGAFRNRLGLHESIPLGEVLKKLTEALTWLAYGQPWLGQGLVLAAGICTGLALVRAGFHLATRSRAEAVGRILWLMAVLAVPFGWAFFARNHTYIHAWFVVYFFAPALGWALAAPWIIKLPPNSSRIDGS